MSAPANKAKQQLRLELEAIIKQNREAFEGEYGDEIDGLLGLSRDEIDAITPGVTDLETYAKLIDVVKEASRRNLSQAELKDRIQALGSIGVDIAKKVGSLA
jgi:hypothetical protein